MTREFRPIGDVLPGVEILEMEDGCVPLDAIVLIKAIDADGVVNWWTRFTRDLHSVEAVGALVVACDLERGAVQEGFRPADDDDSDD